MPTLTVTAKGQITLKQELLRHLNVQPGQKIQAEKLPDGKIIVQAEKPTGSIADFSGFLYKPGRKALTDAEKLDAKFRAATPVPFVADIVADAHLEYSLKVGVLTPTGQTGLFQLPQFS